MGGNKKIISRLFQKNKKLFCYCISEYPLKISKINWHDAIQLDGFSDHTIGITASILFPTLKKLKELTKAGSGPGERCLLGAEQA